MMLVAKMAKITAQIVAITFIVVAAVVVLTRALLLILPDEFSGQVERALAVVSYKVLPFGYQLTESDEQVLARQDLGNVSGWAFHCFTQNDPGRYYLQQYVGVFDSGDPPKGADVRLNSAYFRVIGLSNVLYWKRVIADRKATTAYNIARLGAFLTIGIGLLTTIFVSLSSTEFGKRDTGSGPAIRLAALILPAIGTAVAAAIAFYDPNGNLARQNQIAGGLRQLHGQLSIVTWKIKCPAGEATNLDEEDAKGLDALEQKYQDLLASTGENRNQPSGQGNPGGGNGGGTGGANPTPSPRIGPATPTTVTVAPVTGGTTTATTAPGTPATGAAATGTSVAGNAATGTAAAGAAASAKPTSPTTSPAH